MVILCNFVATFPVLCQKGMKSYATYGIREYVRMGVLALFLACAYVSDCAARNFLRFNADFSYARDLSRVKSNPAYAGEMAPAEALAQVGSGRTEALTGSNGFAPAFGFGYRYMYRAFVLDLGIGAEYRYCIDRPYDITDAKEAGIDSQQFPYIGHHYWTGRAVHSQRIGVTLPVMMGAEIKHVYFLAGVKAGVDIWGNSREKGAYSMQAEYERYMDVLVNIPGHGIVEKDPYTTDAVTMPSLAWNIRACAEIGYRFGDAEGRKYNRKKVTPRYYIGAFAEYGFMGTSGAYLPLLAGIRLTALLALPEPRQCKCLLF